jgi:hypothetical protein
MIKACISPEGAALCSVGGGGITWRDRISATTAKNTCRVFIRYGLISPTKILAARWNFLAYPVMREGGSNTVRGA